MKNRMMKVLALVSATVLAVGTLTACGSQAEEATAPGAAETTEEAAPAELSGNISLSGSTSMEKLANALAASSFSLNPLITSALVTDKLLEVKVSLTWGIGAIP